MLMIRNLMNKLFEQSEYATVNEEITAASTSTWKLEVIESWRTLEHNVSMLDDIANDQALWGSDPVTKKAVEDALDRVLICEKAERQSQDPHYGIFLPSGCRVGGSKFCILRHCPERLRAGVAVRGRKSRIASMPECERERFRIFSITLMYFVAFSGTPSCL